MAVIDVHDPTMAGDEFRAGFSSDFGTVKSLLDAVLALITEGVEHMDFTYGA